MRRRALAYWVASAFHQPGRVRRRTPRPPAPCAPAGFAPGDRAV